jgi:hypothetical protein
MMMLSLLGMLVFVALAGPLRFQTACIGSIITVDNGC